MSKVKSNSIVMCSIGLGKDFVASKHAKVAFVERTTVNDDIEHYASRVLKHFNSGLFDYVLVESVPELLSHLPLEDTYVVQYEANDTIPSHIDGVLRSRELPKEVIDSIVPHSIKVLQQTKRILSENGFGENLFEVGIGFDLEELLGL